MREGQAMNISPAFSFYPKDFLSSPRVQDMTVDEMGAYCLLLFSAWIAEDQGYLPDDEALLRRICRMSEEQWSRSRALVLSCFEQGEGRVFNKRLLKELDRQRAHREAQRQNALKRYQEDVGEEAPCSAQVCRGSAMAVPSQCQGPAETCLPSSSPSSSPSSKDEDIGVLAFLTSWNQLPGPFPKVKKLGARRVHLLKRLADKYWRDNWLVALSLMAGSSFCRGENDRGWVADLDFFLRPDTVTRLIEGKYQTRKPEEPPRGRDEW